MSELPETPNSETVIVTIRAELAKVDSTRRQRIIDAIALAALGSIPWVGGVLAAAASFKIDDSSSRADALRNQWLEEAIIYLTNHGLEVNNVL